MKAFLKRGFTLIELMVVVAIIGILAAIAIPNFVKYQAKSKQGEAKTNLRSLFTAEKAYFADKDEYTTALNTIGFAPEDGNRYSYRTQGACTAASTWSRPAAAPTGVIHCIDADSVRYSANSGTAMTGLYGNWTSAGYSPATPGTSGTCPNCGFTAGAMGNVDNDSFMDVFMVGTGTLSAALTNGGTGVNPESKITAGIPFNAYSDIGAD